MSELHRLLKSTARSFAKALQSKMFRHAPEHAFIAHPKTDERNRKACQLGDWNICV